jgi:hypothetical protein
MNSKYVDSINEERFDLFLKDLRSGVYLQGSGSLHTIEPKSGGSEVERLCCLGVACIRPAAEGVIDMQRPDMSELDYEIYNVKYDGYNTVDLPLAVADYLGIPEDNRIDNAGGSCNVAFFRAGYDVENVNTHNFTAIGFNDSLHKSFVEIADAFEKEFTKEV